MFHTNSHTQNRKKKKKSKPTVVSPRPCLIAPVPRRGAGAQGVAAETLAPSSRERASCRRQDRFPRLLRRLLNTWSGPASHHFACSGRRHPWNGGGGGSDSSLGVWGHWGRLRTVGFGKSPAPESPVGATALPSDVG